MDHIWSVFCQRVITDRDTSQVSLIDSIEALTVKMPTSLTEELPQPVGFEVGGVVLSFWTRSDLNIPETGKARVRVLAPDGQLITALDAPELEIDLANFRRLRTHVGFPVLPLRGEGRYWIVVEMLEGDKWLGVSKVPFEVVVEGPPNTAEDASVGRKSRKRRK